MDYGYTIKTQYDCDDYWDWDDWDPLADEGGKSSSGDKCECGGMHMDIENHYDFCPLYEAWAKRMGIL